MAPHVTGPGGARSGPRWLRLHQPAWVMLVAALGTLGSGACADDPIAPTHEHQVALVEVTPATLVVEVGDRFTLTATPWCTCGAEVPVGITWTSEDPTVASVDATGELRAIHFGTVEIRAEASGIEGTAEVWVLPKGHIAGGAPGRPRL